MAITAAITASPSSVTNPLAWDTICTVSNSGAAAVNVTACEPNAATASGPTASVSLGRPAIGPGQNVTVPASGTLALHYGARAHAPAGSSDGFTQFPSSWTYTLGATVWTDDGSVTIATTASMVVTAPTAT